MLLLVACGQEPEAPTPSLAATDPPEAATDVAEAATDEAETVTEVGDSETDSGMLAPAGVARETYLAPFPVAITVDGDLDDWENVPTVSVPEAEQLLPGSTSVRFAAAADDEFLYLMGDVIDAKIISGRHGSNYWNEDSLEFYLNGTGDLGLQTYGEGVAQLTVPPLNAGLPPEEVVTGGVQGETMEAVTQVQLSEDGYHVEVAVPLKNRVWNMQREHGNVIGLQVHLNGATEADRNLKAIWSIFDRSDTSYQNPSLFGQLIFFEIGQTEVVANIVEPTPAPTRPSLAADLPYKNADLPVAERVADLMGRMTLADKIGQMTLVEKNSVRAEDIGPMGIGGLLSGGGGYPDGENTAASWAAMVDGFQQHAMASHFGIPLIYGVDAVHGHSNVKGTVIFPHNIGLGAANDPALMTAIGQVTAREMIATGIYWNYAPAVSVPQDIRWGRTFEGYSENTEQVSELATAYLVGLQGADLGAADTVLATPKHYVGDGGAAWGSSTTGSYIIDQGVTEVDEETLRAVHLPPYVAAMEAGAQSIMISYSSWDGLKMHAQRYLIRDVLRDELGFSGFIVSDWAGIDQISNDFSEAVVAAINAGIDMNMVPYDYRRFMVVLTQAVEEGAISQERIDEAVSHILTVKFSMGLFERPYSQPELLGVVGSSEHRAIARQAVSQSAVLLKNEGEILPLSADLQNVYVAGDAADDIGIQSGGWTIEWQGDTGEITGGTTILEGIEAAVSPGTTVHYDGFGRFEEVAAGEGMVCIGVVGERPYAEGLGDSADLRIPTYDLRVLNRLQESCDELVVVLISGRPLMIGQLVDNWDALVAAWLPGSEGQGVADVLFGAKPFTGLLPYTWPLNVDQLPLDLAKLTESEVLYPFGFGLETVAP
jgi:beta-glucosidase